MGSEYIKLSKDEFSCKERVIVKIPSVHIKYTGQIEFNHSAMELLGRRVSFCAEKSSRNCFAVMRDVEGYEMRDAYGRRGVFNNASLARHLIDKTWERDVHAADARRPQSMVFIIASLPVDDTENKDTFALIRKK